MGDGYPLAFLIKAVIAFAVLEAVSFFFLRYVIGDVKNFTLPIKVFMVRCGRAMVRARSEGIQ